MVSIDIEVKVNKFVMPTESKDDLLRICDYFQSVITVMGMTPLAPKAVAPNEHNAIMPPNTPPRRHKNVPVAGKRTIDYAIQAAKTIGHPCTTRELAEAMTANGWTTTSSSRTTIVRNTIFDNPIFSQDGEGLWYLAAKASQTGLNFNETSSAQNLNGHHTELVQT
jgi:hypothetical protein